MPLSYTQNLEDYHLSLAFAGQEHGFYIDIGAGHPVADNVSLWFYERGWSGIVAEPIAALADLYKKIRPRDMLYQGLVGRSVGEVDFFHVNRLHGFSTTIELHADVAKEFGADYQRLTLPMLTLEKLCEQHQVQQIDFLKIDVEGAESDVLAGNNFNLFRPKVIVAEAVTPGKGEPAWEAYEPLLLANGYKFRLFDTLNRFYVAEECPEIFERLPAERAPWDDVTHMYEIGRAPEQANHPDYALAQQLGRGFWASLPHLDQEVLRDILFRGKRPQDLAVFDQVSSPALRIALGRIACGYDGGQIVDE
jgi:FkbM family methyltransferase